MDGANTKLDESHAEQLTRLLVPRY
eukprot:COSAG06_NODE_25389_length_638_cov_0.951763_1_plen_24_part_10